MTKKISTTKQGFTIIEVVLVLAIAGLIFLMVFVAFPALQRNQRDTQRRQDYSDLSAAIISHSSNSNGNFPAATSGFVNSNSLLKSVGKRTTITPAGGTATEVSQDAAGNTYTIQIISTTGKIPTANLTAGQILVVQSADCGTNGTAPAHLATANAKAYAIYGFLENGSYCYAGQI